MNGVTRYHGSGAVHTKFTWQQMLKGARKLSVKFIRDSLYKLQLYMLLRYPPCIMVFVECVVNFVVGINFALCLHVNV